jgi:hypothetical protein
MLFAYVELERDMIVTRLQGGLERKRLQVAREVRRLTRGPR